MRQVAPNEPFWGVDDPSTLTPLVLSVAGPVRVGRPRLSAATGALTPLPTPGSREPWAREAWERLSREMSADEADEAHEASEADGDAQLAAALRGALASGRVGVPLSGGGWMDVVRLPSGSAIFEVPRSDGPPSVLEAHDVVFSGTSVEWEAFFRAWPASRLELRPAPTPEGELRAVVRFATTHGVHADHGDRGEAGFEPPEIARHPSAEAAGADWMWCGHRVYGDSMLLVWFDASAEVVARWFQGALRARAASATPECPEPRPAWEIGVDGEVLFVRRSFLEPTDAYQLQWERWALARALEAPFEVLSWQVTETETGGSGASGRDRASLREYLSDDADPGRREALRAAYRAPSTRSVKWAGEGVPTLAEALGVVLPALGGVSSASPRPAELRALARSGARAQFPQRLELRLRPGADRDGAGFALLSALDAEVSGTVAFSIRWDAV